MIIKAISMGSMDNNCYIVADQATRHAVIIDAPTWPNRILEVLHGEDWTCEYILLTHAHYDHIGAVDGLKAATGAKLAIHGSESDWLNDPEKNLARLAGAGSPAALPDFCLSDGDILSVGSLQIQCIHTPGHTVGSMCFYITDKEGQSALFSGDTLFFSDVGRCDLPGGSYSEIKHSIRSKLYILPDETGVYPGHGRSTSIGYEKNNNHYIRQDWEYEY